MFKSSFLLQAIAFNYSKTYSRVTCISCLPTRVKKAWRVCKTSHCTASKHSRISTSICCYRRQQRITLPNVFQTSQSHMLDGNSSVCSENHSLLLFPAPYKIGPVWMIGYMIHVKFVYICIHKNTLMGVGQPGSVHSITVSHLISVHFNTLLLTKHNKDGKCLKNITAKKSVNQCL